MGTELDSIQPVACTVPLIHSTCIFPRSTFPALLKCALADGISVCWHVNHLDCGGVCAKLRHTYPNPFCLFACTKSVEYLLTWQANVWDVLMGESVIPRDLKSSKPKVPFSDLWVDVCGFPETLRTSVLE